MHGFLAGTYQFVSVLLYLAFSSSLLYRRLFGRWLHFSLCFPVLYLIGAYAFFGRVPLPFGAGVRDALASYLFLFGSVGCIGYCLTKGLSLLQSMGALSCYWFVILTAVFLASDPGSVTDWVTLASIVLLILGIPGVLGIGLVRGWCARQQLGGVLLFVVVMGAFVTTVDATMGYEPSEELIQRLAGLFSRLTAWFSTR